MMWCAQPPLFFAYALIKKRKKKKKENKIKHIQWNHLKLWDPAARREKHLVRIMASISTVLAELHWVQTHGLRFYFFVSICSVRMRWPWCATTRWASRSTFSQWFEVGVRLQCRLLPGGACQPGLPERSHLEWTRTILQKGKAIICSNSGVFRSRVRVVLCGGGGLGGSRPPAAWKFFKTRLIWS